MAPGAASVMAVDRANAEELLQEGVSGVAEKVDIASEREMPVEEILRRLQAVEDDQARRLLNYQATSTLHLRFRPGTGNTTVDVAFEGPFFFRRKEGIDWVWQNLYINGVRWKSKKLPEIPLIQPEKAATMPLEINFTKEYTYRLRGQETIEGRNCWVVDFVPVEAKAGLLAGHGVGRPRDVRPGAHPRPPGGARRRGDLERGDHDLRAGRRKRPARAVGHLELLPAAAQRRPADPLGAQHPDPARAGNHPDRDPAQHHRLRRQPADRAWPRTPPWCATPQQASNTWSKTSRASGWCSRSRTPARSSWSAALLRRVARLPAAAAGVNYLDLDFRGTGNQVNVFFAGPLLTANYAEPRLFGSKWDAGVNVFGFFLPTTDEIYRGGEDPVDAEQVDSSYARAAFFLGRPLGNFTKLDFTYIAGFRKFKEADDTDPSLRACRRTPDPHLPDRADLHPVRLAGQCPGELQPAFEVGVLGPAGQPASSTRSRRTTCAGRPRWPRPGGSPNSCSSRRRPNTWAARISTASARYDFGIFGDANVAGYPSGLVRAEEAWGTHLEYGVNVGDAFKLELDGDAMWATDEATGLDSELLAGRRPRRQRSSVRGAR